MLPRITPSTMPWGLLFSVVRRVLDDPGLSPAGSLLIPSIGSGCMTAAVSVECRGVDGRADPIELYWRGQNQKKTWLTF